MCMDLLCPESFQEHLNHPSSMFRHTWIFSIKVLKHVSQVAVFHEHVICSKYALLLCKGDSFEKMVRLFVLLRVIGHICLWCLRKSALLFWLYIRFVPQDAPPDLMCYELGTLIPRIEAWGVVLHWAVCKHRRVGVWVYNAWNVYPFKLGLSALSGHAWWRYVWMSWS